MWRRIFVFIETEEFLIATKNEMVIYVAVDHLIQTLINNFFPVIREP